jgi:hypothetical protein
MSHAGATHRPAAGGAATATAAPSLSPGGRSGGTAGKQAQRSTTTLQAALQETQARSSSAAGIEAYVDSTSGLSAKQKKAYVLKRRADEARIQQLRGIFAAYDENRDGHLVGR